MKTEAEIQQLIDEKKNDLFRLRPLCAVYEFVGFLNALQKLGFINIEEAYRHSINFTERF